jgi:hypothetical protein
MRVKDRHCSAMVSSNAFTVRIKADFATGFKKESLVTRSANGPTKRRADNLESKPEVMALLPYERPAAAILHQMRQAAGEL